MHEQGSHSIKECAQLLPAGSLMDRRLGQQRAGMIA
jgi:hypothetical protein